jgi:hypothetical protein
MVRPTLHVLDAVAPQLFLEIRRAAPGRVLPALVGQDLARRAVIRNAARQRLHHQRAALVMRHRKAHQIAGVIVEKRSDVDTLVLPQQKREEVGLPQLVWLGALEASLLGSGFWSRRLALLRQPFFLQHPAHRRFRRPDAEETFHHVANPSAAGLRLRRLRHDDRFAT